MSECMSFAAVVDSLRLLEQFRARADLTEAERHDLRSAYLTFVELKDAWRERMVRASDLRDRNDRLSAALTTEIRERFPRVVWDADMLREYVEDEYGILPSGEPSDE